MTDAVSLSVLFAIVGAVVGSFVGASVIRVPEGRGIVTGRSACDSCGAILSAFELIPIFSFAIQRGRCRHCRTRIAIDQLFAELGCSAAGLLATLSSNEILDMIALSLFVWVLVAVALLDARHHWLPDLLTLPLVIAGLVRPSGLDGPTLSDRLAGAVIGYAILELLRRCYRWARHRDGLGGGDPKLFAAIGMWLGVGALPWIMLGAGLLGLLTVAWRAIRGNQISRVDRLPLGTLLAIAAVIIMPLQAQVG